MRYLILTTLLIMSTPAWADLQKAMDSMCDKMKTCSVAEIKKQELPPEMAPMIEAMFDGMCKTWMGPYAEALGKAGLEDKAEACVESVVSESCEDLMSREGDFTSPECEEFKKAADEAGVEVD
ncbi:MAG: hypothetical protein HKN50_11810 [Gammaproteobacteria bacterium]|nr:hypothetical protein [Gammaproteobacteria bacterium]